MNESAVAVDRRSNIVQRAAVTAVLARAKGSASIFRADDGSVFVYDEQRDRIPPLTVRTMVTIEGLVRPPVILQYEA
jgi:hypothetical protein